jgi:phytoene dehydrogenase-like protein
MSRVVVVGAGFAGLAAAIALAARGHRVTIIEARPAAGGVARQAEIGGARVDLGPTILTDLEPLRALASIAGVALEDLVSLDPLDPGFVATFPGDARLALHRDPGQMAADLGRLGPDAERDWARALDLGARALRLARHYWVRGDLAGPRQLARFLLAGGISLADLAPFIRSRSLARAARTVVRTPELRSLLTHFARLVGLDADRAPAVTLCIPYLMATSGVWYPRGGVTALAQALLAVATKLGAAFETETAVERLELAGDRVGTEHFASDRLRRAFSFQTLYLGTRPEATPAAYVMIPFVEAALGVWYPEGGVHQIALAMARLAAELGVQIHLEAPVREIVTEGDRAVGVRLDDGRSARADVVVANADWAYTQRVLLRRGGRTHHLDQGCSGVLFLVAVERRVEGPHHTFLLSSDFDGNLADIFDRRCLPERPSIYLARPTATDASVAPAGTELLYVLVPAPTLESGVDWRREMPGFRKKVFDRLSLAGLGDLEAHIVAEAALTPETFGTRYNLSRGSAFGLAATLLQSGPFRPAIRSRRYRHLYHAGASSHPGGGVPMVTLAGRMVADAIEADTARVRVHSMPPAPAGARERAWSGSVSS